MGSNNMRAWLCDRCGAPIELARGATSATCRYCKAVNTVPVAAADGFVAPPVAPLTEEQRIQALRTQDASPRPEPPADLAPLLSGGRLAEFKLEEAFAVFQATRQEVATTAGPAAAERLFYLSTLLSAHLEEAKDVVRARALLETALAGVQLPRQKQVLRAALAELAVRGRDLDQAEEWLSSCDARSSDLHADSAFRVVRALVDTERGRFAEVLTLVGDADGAVPILDTEDTRAAVLRANALERTGRMDAAIQVLARRMSDIQGTARAQMLRFREQYPWLTLCASSYPAAEKRRTGENLAVEGPGAGCGLLVLSTILLTIGAIGVYIALAPYFAGDHARGINARLGKSWGSPFVMMGVMLLVPSVIMILLGRRDARIIRTGIQTRATIVSLKVVPHSKGSSASVTFELSISLPGEAPYTTSLSDSSISKDAAAAFRVGEQIAVYVDPKNPKRVLRDKR